MLEQLARNWWMMLIRGMVAIVLAVIGFSQPGIALAALVWVWGAYAFVDGVFALVLSVQAAERRRRWGMLLLEGLTGLAAGIIAFAWTGITALVLLYLIAGWAIVTGIFEIAAAAYLRKLVDGEWRLIVSGVLSIVLGVLLAAWPGAGLVTVVWIIGFYALLFGVMLIALAFRLRALSQQTTSPASPPTS